MRFDHMAFQVSNLDAAIAFYTEKLGFSLDFNMQNEAEQEVFAFLNLGNVRLELLQDLQHSYTPPPIQHPYCPHLAISIDDMQAAVHNLKTQGIAIIRGPMLIEDKVTWLYFADPDNNVIEYVQWFNEGTL